MSTFYLTTPIYYPNARPHVGSAYTTIVCDVLARYKRMCGYDVAFLTGTDEHGEKLQRAADAAGVPVERFVSEKRELFRDLWRKLGIPQFDPERPSEYGYRFVHTSQNPDHVAAVHWMIRQADKAGYIKKEKYEGRYCIYDERYVSDSPEPTNCDICGRPAELISEENYFFKLSAFGGEEGRLMTLYREHPEFVQPDFRRNEVLSFVKGGLRDISISRRRLKWGVPWPGDSEQVVYVWYDALTSYLTGIGFAGDKRSRDFEKYWMGKEGPAEVVHMIGKDILRFHAVYWPAFLMAANDALPEAERLPLPRTIFAHGWIYYEQDKMSKSKGNVVYPEPIIDAFESFGAPGNDALRYYLLREAPFGQDTSFSYEGLIQRYNSDLANDLGNLANRTITMLNRYFNGEIPSLVVAANHSDQQAWHKLETYESRTAELVTKSEILQSSFTGRLKDYDFFYALANTWGTEPLYLDYVSVLLDGAGKPLVSPTVVEFILYEEQHGGTPVWTERQLVTPDSTGRYKVKLGAASPRGLPEELFGPETARWMSVRHGLPTAMERPRVPSLRASEKKREPLGLIAATNKYLSDNAPWTLAETNFPANRDRVATILCAAAKALRFLGVLLAPTMPYCARRLWNQLGCEEYLGKIEDQRIDQLKWGGLKPGTKVGKPEPIFPRLDKAKTLAKLEEFAEADRNRSHPKGAQVSVPFEDPSAVGHQQSAESGQSSAIGHQPANSELRTPNSELPKAEGGQPSAISLQPANSELRTPNSELPKAESGQPSAISQQPTNSELRTPNSEHPKITIDDFAKVEMVVGQIISAEAIPKAQKLLKLQVDIGTETRQVCAGIAEFYKPEEVIGMKIVLVANLEPRKLRGVESNGMVVAASIGPEGRPVLATFKEDVPNGTRLK